MPEKKDDVAADTFFSVDMRTGRVVDVEDFPEARNPSYKMTVDFGPEIGTLTTSAQATHYSKEDLIGRMVVAAINLGAKRIAGFKSEFLVLGATPPDGRIRLLEVDDTVEPGWPIT